MVSKWFRRSCLVLLSLAALATGGCWSAKNINDLAFVVGLGVDQAPEGRVRLTVQIAVPSAAGQAGEGGGGGQSEPVWVVSATGRSTAECSINLRKLIDRRLFYGHNRIVIFGEKRMRHDISQDLDLFERLPQFRRSMSVFIAKGEARAILQAKSKLDPIGAIALVRLADIQSFNLALGDFISSVESEEEDAVVPVLSTAPPEGFDEVGKKPRGEKEAGGEQKGGDQPPGEGGGEKETTTRLEGLAVFRAKKLAGYLFGEDASGLFLYRNQFPNRPMTIQSERFGNIEIYVRRSKGETEITWHNGKPRFEMRIDVIADVFQLKRSFDLTDESIVSAVENEIARQMKRSVAGSMNKSQRYRSDIFGLGGEVFRKTPRKWRQIRHEWPQLYSQAPVTVISSVQVIRTGSTIRPPEPHF